MNSHDPRNNFVNNRPSRTRRLRPRAAWALMAAAGVLLGGCQILPPASADSTRFFVLSAPSSPEAKAPGARGRLTIGLRAIELPAYLRATKSMVVREGRNEVRYQDYSRWAEPLEAGIGRALRDQLLNSPDVRDVDVYPLRGDVARDYDVRVRVIRCEGVRGAEGVARFSASYEIVAADGPGQVVAARSFTAPEAAWEDGDFGELAAKLSEAVAALGAQIAADLPK